MTAISAVASDNTNLTTGANAPAIDHSYSRFPLQKMGDDQTTTMGFSDFLDMINPLQHIPVVSSIYRAVTDSHINPVSRIAGDALYGAAFGLASAGISALAAVGDEAFASLNDGKSASSTVMAALFGSDKDQTTQLASIDAPPPSTNTGTPSMPAMGLIGALQSPAKQSPILDVPNLPISPTLAANTSTNSVNPAQNNNIPLADAAAVPAAVAGQGMPLDRSKAAYGGVMDTAMVQNAQQNQALALALAGGRNAMQSQHDMRNNRFSTSNNMNSSVSAPTNAPATIITSIPTPQAAAIQNQIASSPAAQSGNSMQALIQNLQGMKALNQYKNTAQSRPTVGSTLDMAN